MIKFKILIYGLLSSLFFSFTFILNRSMALSGGNYLWSASLRYIFSLPFLFLILLYKKRIRLVHMEIRKNTIKWTIWSFVGFVMFYVPLTFASNYGTSWLVAATWQFSIIVGILSSPLFGHKLPIKNLLISLIILVGVFLLQIHNIATFRLNDTILCLIPVVIASISYIIGNRKMMTVCPKNINTIERIYGMTLCSFPIWIIISIIAYKNSGLPTEPQLIQAFLVCVFSALIATILFFYATDMANHNPKLLAIAESTISGEVIFTLIGSLIFLKDVLPDIFGFIGIIVILIGMVLNTFTKV